MLEKIKYKNTKIEFMSLDDYLKKAIKEPSVYYASAAERLLKAIGEPELVDTSKDPKLKNIFAGKTIPIYKPFADLFGMENVIEKLISYLKHSSQNLEESKQILYLLGPVGGGKSSLSEKIKVLIEQEPIYVLCDKEGKLSPVFESPMGLFKNIPEISNKINIRTIMSPWALKRLGEYDGDFSKFQVAKIYPDQLKQQAVSKTEPSDENNQDVSALVGKLDIRKLEHFDQSDPDAYSYSGALCLSNQGVLEFVEMFKSPLKVLNPLLTATQERNYKGTEQIGNIPFDGIILSHSNFSEWDTFKNNPQNEAFLDRIYTIEVPYNLRLDEEIKIYQNFINKSNIKDKPIVKKTLELLATYNILTRLTDIKDENIYSKLKVYNGEDLRGEDHHVKTIEEYKELAGINEGTMGISTRMAFKIISRVYNYDLTEISADPINLFKVIKDTLSSERYSEDIKSKYSTYLESILKEEYIKHLRNLLSEAYIESFEEFGQNLFVKYFTFADYWLQDQSYRDPETGEQYDRKHLDEFLSKIEKKAGIANPKDFRNEIVNMNLRYRGHNQGKDMSWKADTNMREVIKKQVDINNDDVLKSLSKKGTGSKEDKLAYERVVKYLTDKGYTEKQIKRNIDWFNRVT